MSQPTAPNSEHACTNLGVKPIATLCNKRLLLGVSGGIAAYKSAELIRRLQDAGAEVRVIMTRAAQEFITPLTLQALSGNPVHTDLLDPSAEAAMGHIELARWADIILIAPASADIIARLAAGKGDDLLTTVCLASKAPLALAPAMNQAMYSHAATQANLTLLAQRQVHLFGPGQGYQACGDIGAGRMLEVEALVSACAQLFQIGLLTGKTVAISAGPTREAIDPVRYISNHSSGKMGYALATACVEAGAKVTLISGPVALPPPARVHLIQVESALEMHAACLKSARHCDLFIGAAAVADYRTQNIDQEKIKKQEGEHQLTLTLVKNPDIIAAVAALGAQHDALHGTQYENKPFTVGFAAETQSVLEYARSKLKQKKLDAIVANDVSQSDTGFNSDDNAATLISAHTEITFDRRSKNQLARDLIKHIAALMTAP